MPIPGLPPNRVTEPGTMPPPRVRLNSGSGRIWRLVPVAGISPILRGASLILGCPLRLIRGASGLLTTSSTKVFHCSQDGQRPSQREAVAPQLEQTKMVRALAKRENFFQKWVNLWSFHGEGRDSLMGLFVYSEGWSCSGWSGSWYIDCSIRHSFRVTDLCVTPELDILMMRLPQRTSCIVEGVI